MKKLFKMAMLAVTGLIIPALLQAQDMAGEMHSLQEVLDKLYDEMLPMCSKLIGVGQGLAGFGALWYIAARVWRHLANAEPIDFYPLFRPFVLGFCVMIFPSVIAMINGVMQPTVSGTASMVEGSDKAIAELLKQKEEAIKKTETWQMYVGESGSGDRDRWYKYAHPDDPDGDGEGMFESIGNDIKFAMAKASYNFRNSVKEWMSEILKVLYEAAALCINTIRTFYLIVLAILGPLVFGLAVFDGLHHTVSMWLARYINIFLWLPVANIFGAIIGKIQENMLKMDIQQVTDYGDTFFSATDTAYLVFMVIGIVGYFTIPSIANHIVNAGGGGALTHKMTSMFAGGTSMLTNAATSSVTRAGTGAVNVISTPSYISQGYNSGGGQGDSKYHTEKLSGK